MTEQQPKPTEAEIAAAFEIAGEIETRGTTAQSNAVIIARHNAPLNAKLAAQKAAQKAALELAQKTICWIDEWDGDDARCPFCLEQKSLGHLVICKRISTLAAIKEALQ